MTNDEIRAIAHQVAKDYLDGTMEGDTIWIGDFEDFATRFLAAITEKAALVAWMNVDPKGGAIFFRTNVSHVATIPLVAAYELTAAQAREAELREALEHVIDLLGDYRGHSSYAEQVLALPTDTTALDERLAQEREKFAEQIIERFAICKTGCYADEIRSMK